MNCIDPSSILTPTRRVPLGALLPDEEDHCGVGARVSMRPLPARSAGVVTWAVCALVEGAVTTVVAGAGGGVTITAVGTGCARLAQAARTATATRESGKLSCLSMEASLLNGYKMDRYKM